MAVPFSTAVTVPFDTVATFASEVDHVTVLLVALAGATVAVKVLVFPLSRVMAVASNLTSVTAMTAGVVGFLGVTVTLQAA